jgi:hypothetical protein
MSLVMESSLARLRLEPNFFIIVWKDRAEKSAQLDRLNWKKFRLEKLDISWFTECFLGLKKTKKKFISVVKIRSKNQLFQIKTALSSLYTVLWLISNHSIRLKIFLWIKLE